jgi:hypothetical protein
MGMKLTVLDPPREFAVGADGQITLKDCAHIELKADEQVTFFTEEGSEYDVTRKTWGFYATPSLNGRLSKFGWRALLVKNRAERFFVYLIERGKEADCHSYLASEQQTIVCWLDNDRELSKLEEKRAVRE